MDLRKFQELNLCFQCQHCRGRYIFFLIIKSKKYLTLIFIHIKSAKDFKYLLNLVLTF
jgi:hypothetical protein